MTQLDLPLHCVLGDNIHKGGEYHTGITTKPEWYMSHLAVKTAHRYARASLPDTMCDVPEVASSRSSASIWSNSSTSGAVDGAALAPLVSQNVYKSGTASIAHRRPHRGIIPKPSGSKTQHTTTQEVAHESHKCTLCVPRTDRPWLFNYAKECAVPFSPENEL